MIRYSLNCVEGHSFESWFASADAFDGLVKAKMVECPECGGRSVSKALMAPKVTGTKLKTTDDKSVGAGREKALAEVIVCR